MLNQQQKKAIETTEGRVLILAGAGSGKTSVIINRIAHLIQNVGISPKAILGLTFTNKAAEEMRKRLAALIDPAKAKQVMLCTFHSFCMQLLRRDIHKLGYTKEFSLYDERDIRRLLGQLARNLLCHEGELPSLETTLEMISLAKNRALTKEELQGSDLSKELYESLTRCLRAYNAVDFDSLLSLSLQLLEEHPDVLAYYQERFQYIMIDEYQDTNPVQYRLACRLSARSNNLCVVGDDDQAIYGWRGADVNNILRFTSDTVIKLEQNYRSTPVILHAANALIRNNRERYTKELWSSKERGDLITLFHAPSENDEIQAIIHRMIGLHKNKKIPWKEMAILYRSNNLSRGFEIALPQIAWENNGEWIRGIPYKIFGGTEFYERSEIKDITAYLRVALNRFDQEALLRIINLPRRGISDQTLDKLTQINRSKNIPLWEVLLSPPADFSERAIKGIRSFVLLIETLCNKLHAKPYAPAVQWLVDTIDYNQAIIEDVKSEKMRQFKAENVAAFIAALSDYEDSLEDFLGSISLDQNSWEPSTQQKEDCISLMTFHSAKGLEFTACFLTGLEDAIIPHEKSLAEGRLEEERRLMYVAMTRAKKHLYLSMSRQRKRYGKNENSNPSRFLFEIPKECLQLVPWDQV